MRSGFTSDLLWPLLLVLQLGSCTQGADDRGIGLVSHTLVKQGQQLFAAGDYDAALEVLDRARQDSTVQGADRVQANLYTARAHLSLGKLDQARADLQPALEASPDDPELREILGAVFAALATSRASHVFADSALAAYGKALELDGHRSLVLYNMAMVYAYLDSSRLVEQTLLDAIAADSTLAAAHKKIGVYYRKSGSMDKALGHLDQARRLAPDDAEALFYLALVLRTVGRAEEAVEHLERAAELNPYSPQVHYNLGTLYVRLGRREEGRQILRRSELLRRNERGQRSEITAPGKGALAIGTGRFHCQLALNHALRGEYREAIVGFRNAVEVEPNLHIAHSSLGVLLAMQGHLEKAAGSFERAIEIDSMDAVSYTRLGLVRIKLGDYGAAGEALRKAARIDSTMPELAFTRGLLAARAAHPREALVHLARAVELRPSYVDAHLNLGVLHMQLGQLTDAAQAYGRVIELDPGNAQAHLYLSDTFKKLGEEAKSQLHRQWARQLKARQRQ